jgi:hypothetical protein
MSRRGLYIGGHTVIGPRSLGWFSKSKRKKPKGKRPLIPPNLEQIAQRERKEEEQRRTDEQRRQAKREKSERKRDEQKIAAATRVAKLAARNSPEAVAQRAQNAPIIRAKLDRRMVNVVVIHRRRRLTLNPENK